MAKCCFFMSYSLLELSRVEIKMAINTNLNKYAILSFTCNIKTLFSEAYEQGYT